MFSGLLGRGTTVRICLMIEKILEEHNDECLRILNENNIDQKDLRKVEKVSEAKLQILVEMRDKGYEMNEQIQDKYQIRVN